MTETKYTLINTLRPLREDEIKEYANVVSSVYHSFMGDDFEMISSFNEKGEYITLVRYPGEDMSEPIGLEIDTFLQQIWGPSEPEET